MRACCALSRSTVIGWESTHISLLLVLRYWMLGVLHAVTLSPICLISVYTVPAAGSGKSLNYNPGRVIGSRDWSALVMTWNSCDLLTLCDCECVDVYLGLCISIKVKDHGKIYSFGFWDRFGLVRVGVGFVLGVTVQDYQDYNLEYCGSGSWEHIRNIV